MSKLIETVENLKQVYKYEKTTFPRLGEAILMAYELGINMLKEQGETYPWEQMLEIEDKHKEIEARLPDVTDDEFEEYIYLGDLLAVLVE